MASAAGDLFKATDFTAIFKKLEETREKHYNVYRKPEMSTAYATDIPKENTIGSQQIYGNADTLNTILGDIKNLANSPNIDYTSVISGLNIPKVGDLLSYTTHYTNLTTKVDAISNICAYQANYTSESQEGNYGNYTSTTNQGNYATNYTSSTQSCSSNYTSQSQEGNYGNYTSASSQGNYAQYTSAPQSCPAYFTDVGAEGNYTTNYTSANSQGNYSTASGQGNYTSESAQGNYTTNTMMIP